MAEPQDTDRPARAAASAPTRCARSSTADEPSQEPDQGKDVLRRPQLRRPGHRAPSRRRRQAPLPADRLQAHQGRDPGQRGLHRVRPQPLGEHRAAQLRRRREALHPRARRGCAVGAEVVSGEGADIAPGNSLSLARIPTGTVVHNVELIPGQGGRLGPRRRHRDPGGRQGGPDGEPPAALLGGADGPRRVPRDRRARSRTPSTRTSRSARPAATVTRASARRPAASR